MRTIKFICLAACFVAPMAQAACPANAEDGDTCRSAKSTAFQVYDAALKQWVDPDRFLTLRRGREGKLTWGESRDYPPYKKVKELDTFRAVTRTGMCDMVFFHGRWRLQADVWVWGDEMKTWRGCATVFE